MTDQIDPVRIIVQNLAFDTTKEELSAAFGRFGEIVDCVMAADAAGRSRGFGFITYSTTEGVKKATADGVEVELGGRELRVQVANQRKEPSGNKPKGARAEKVEAKASGPKLYCGDLPWELSSEELAAHFEKFGKVENAYLAEVQYAASVNGYKPHRGFGFVEFSTEEEATKALKEPHVLKGVTFRVTSAKGEAKERKKKAPNNTNTSSNNNNDNIQKKDDAHRNKDKKDENKEEKKEKKERKEKGEKKKDEKKKDEKKEERKEKREEAPGAAVQKEAPKKSGIKIPAAPKTNPWSKKGAEGSGDAAPDAKNFPTLADVASGKVKQHKKTEDEIAAEIAAERAAASGKGKGKEEAE